jgi:hypothetical protein
MKVAGFFLLAAVFGAGAGFFLFRGSELVLGDDYIGGLIHLLVGLGTARGSLELARLAALTRDDGV